MSNAYLEKYGDQEPDRQVIREWSSRPGRQDEDGKPIYFTQQHSKDACDVNSIIRRYEAGELISHVSRFEGTYGDVPSVDYHDALTLVTNAMSLFQELPSNIRKRFKNDPAELLKFMESPSNRQEAIELGLIDKDWTEATDGLGEHVQEGENVKKEPKPGPKPDEE
jgi:phage internal scaffolding protein